jgi:hypothetical protein
MENQFEVYNPTGVTPFYGIQTVHLSPYLCECFLFRAGDGGGGVMFKLSLSDSLAFSNS